MASIAPVAASRRWRKPPLIRNPLVRWVTVIGALTYLVLAIQSVTVNPERWRVASSAGNAF